MLPGFVAGHYGRDDLDIDLVKLTRFANARLILGAAQAVDPVVKTVTVGTRFIPYDVASIDIGITSEMPFIPGFDEHGIPAKPLGMYSQKWEIFRATNVDQAPAIAVLGGGVAGTELAMAMSHALTKDDKAPIVQLIDNQSILSAVGDGARERLLQRLAGMNINVIENAEIVRIDADMITLADGRILPSVFTVGAAGGRPYDWLADIGLTLEGGYIAVDPMLRSSDPSIYAVGDCAHLTHAPRPKAGVFAVREAPILLHNLRADLSGGTHRRFQPQKDYLKLISLGGQDALAEKFDRAFSGPLLWKWKDRIDRTFMDKFTKLPAMQQKLPHVRALGTDAQPMCGGCGAKVGREALQTALAAVPQVGRSDVTALAGDDAALLTVGGQQQVITTDHLRSFTLDPAVHTRITAHHALGDILAMGAVPQAVTTSVILPRMSTQLQASWMAEIMGVAAGVFASVGAEIVGGHSSLGSEFTVGFTITGLLDANPITLAGAKAGDALILTKPIGSGTIMAAEMAGAARGETVTTALNLMAEPQAKAAKTLKLAHAMTDVTGFGLAGHLMGMCEASGLAATVTLSDVPLMSGVLELAQNGTKSSLYPDNRMIDTKMTFTHSARVDLIFDPQTAGGMLAAIDPKDVTSVLKQLRKDDYQAACIGRLVDDAPHITLLD
jgi:selenide,water dikinase